MKVWTNSAKDRMEGYLRDRVLRSKLDPEEAAEIVEDWRLHVHEEVEQGPGTVVSLELLEQVLLRLGNSEEELEAWTPPASSPPRQVSSSRRNPNVHPWIWIFAVILPAGVIAFEAVAGFCANVFFNPIPTWMHLLLISLVPAGNAWFLHRMDGGEPSKVMAPLAGFLLIVTAFYGLLFLPLLPASLLAVVVFGLGFLSLMPLLAWWSSFLLSRHIRDKFGATLGWKRGWRCGALAGVLTIAALGAGPLVTRLGLEKALSEDSERSRSGLAQLRSFHVQSTLLRACYEGNLGTTMATDISGWIVRGWRLPFAMLDLESIPQQDSERVREVFYRVTGKSFNTFSPPSHVAGTLFGSRGELWDNVEFDEHLGGDQVAVRIRGLSMDQSRLDAHLDRASNLGYIEWTCEFLNRSPEAREARFQVMLPEDGVISRVTLWVNGEPREAAFASKGRVKAAYKEIAVVQRKDPVLVTACGPGRAMVQCFPVLENGGRMKIRIGMTAPLKAGRLGLPVILEQNFAIQHELEHVVWWQSSDPFVFSGKNLSSLPDGSGQSLQVSLKANELGADAWYARLDNETSDEPVWCEDQFAPIGERQLTRTWEIVERPGLARCVVVLDGSVGLREHRELIAQALESLSSQGDLRVLLASDEWEEIDPRAVRDLRFSGGRDNIPALAEAIQSARGPGESAVVWIHAAQPMRGPSSERLHQIMERSAKEVTLYSVALEPGGNRVLEDLFKYRSVHMGPRQPTESGRLETWMRQLLVGGPQAEARWTRFATVADELQGGQVWDQLARWWAAEEVRRMRRVRETDPTLTSLSSKYQLVTAYSGAVVLETDEQYRRHGLQPVDASVVPSVPAVPEPSVILYWVPTVVLALLRRRRRKD